MHAYIHIYIYIVLSSLPIIISLRMRPFVSRRDPSRHAHQGNSVPVSSFKASCIIDV